MALDSWNFGSPDFSSLGSGAGGSGMLSGSAFSSAGGAVQDLFAARGLRTKGAGSRIEAQTYDIAAAMADRNAQFVKTSTDIKQFQMNRSIEKAIGQGEADVAAAGFEASGSALDLMRESASQGALSEAVLGHQGIIEQMGYQDQAKSYRLMAEAARMAAEEDEKAAQGARWGAALKGAAAGASAGSIAGPWGAVAGGVIGGAAGFFAR